MISILLADDHAVVRVGLKELLAEGLGPVDFGEATTGPEVLERARERAWDLVVLDVNMPGRSGLETVKELKELRPELPVLMLSMMSEDEMAVRALRSGAAGYLTKDRAPEEMLAAVRKVLAGGRYVSPELAEQLALEVRGETAEPKHKSLSDREFQVMQLLASGKTVGEIASELSLSVKTISTHRSHLLQKLGLRNNAEVMRYALVNQLV